MHNKPQHLFYFILLYFYFKYSFIHLLGYYKFFLAQERVLVAYSIPLLFVPVHLCLSQIHYFEAKSEKKNICKYILSLLNVWITQIHKNTILLLITNSILDPWTGGYESYVAYTVQANNLFWREIWWSDVNVWGQTQRQYTTPHINKANCLSSPYTVIYGKLTCGRRIPSSKPAIIL